MDSTSKDKLVSTHREFESKKEINLYLPENKTKNQENVLVGNTTHNTPVTDKLTPNFQKSHTPFH